MRILVLVAIAFAILAILRIYRPTAAPPATSDGEPEILPPIASRGDANELSKMLRDASRFFDESRRETAPDQPMLINALQELSYRCDGLSTRVIDQEGLGTPLRQPILRLLLPLNGVAKRSAQASLHRQTPNRDALLVACADALGRAAEEIGQIEERADEVALRRLQVDLEVLEGRLRDESA